MKVRWSLVLLAGGLIACGGSDQAKEKGKAKPEGKTPATDNNGSAADSNGTAAARQIELADFLTDQRVWVPAPGSAEGCAPPDEAGPPKTGNAPPAGEPSLPEVFYQFEKQGVLHIGTRGKNGRAAAFPVEGKLAYLVNGMKVTIHLGGKLDGQLEFASNEPKAGDPVTLRAGEKLSEVIATKILRIEPAEPLLKGELDFGPQ